MCVNKVYNNKPGSYLNLLEPEGVISAFYAEPPEGFEPLRVQVNGLSIPGFLTRLNILTTADDKLKKILSWVEKSLPGSKKLALRANALFLGTTVSEYSIFPGGVNLSALKDSAVSIVEECKCSFLIIKDIPIESPLLSENENAFSRRLISFLADAGFTIVDGQALGFVPIDFNSIDEYLKMFSRSRRKDLRRKLRSFSRVSVEAVSTGSDYLDDAVISQLYDLYLNVYENSHMQFDKMSRSFFRELFRDRYSDGTVFVYSCGEKIVGFNLCYVFRDSLVDKYIGFLYPESRELNLYFLSWFYNLDYCIKNNLKYFISGWTDPAIKSYLGARFTHTAHAVYVRNPILKFALNKLKSRFEPDRDYR